MLTLTLQHGIFMNLDEVKIEPSLGEMWGFIASRHCLLRYSSLEIPLPQPRANHFNNDYPQPPSSKNHMLQESFTF